MFTVRRGRKAQQPVPIRLDKIGSTVFVSVGGTSPAIVAAAEELPAESERLSVVVSDASLASRPELALGLRRWVPARHKAIRLVASRAGSAAAGPPPAQALSDLLEAEVIAPTGDLVVVPGGSLFALTGKEQAGGGQWRRFRPFRGSVAAGRRFPVPDWEQSLTGFIAPDIPGVTVEEIPSGLWVRRSTGGHDRPPPDDLAYAIPMQTDSVAMLVARPGERPVSADDLRRLIEAMPESLREKLTVIPYGDVPVAGGPLGAVVSAAANRAVRVRTGLPLQMPDGRAQVVAINTAGEPTWVPFVQESTWRPGIGAELLSWVEPAEQLLPAGPGELMLNKRWLVEIVEAGLWIREAGRSEGSEVVRQLPLASEQCTVIVGVGASDQATPPWRSVERLLRQLPSEARSRLRIAVPISAGERFANAVAKGCRVALGGGAPNMLTESGQLVPWRSQAAAAAEPATAHTSKPDRKTQRRTIPSTVKRLDRESVEDLHRLLSFVDEIRRTPSWDELPEPTDHLSDR